MFNGKEIRESSGSTREPDARRLLKRRIGEIASKTFIGKDEQRLTFEELATGYLKHYERTGLRSCETARYRVKNLRRFFGNDRACDITTARIIA